MKKILFILCLTSASSALFAQNRRLDLGLAHSWNFADRDITLTATRYWGANGLRAGVHYFQHTAQQTPGWYRMRAETPGQRWGFSLAYERLIRLPESDVEVYPYFSAQYFRLTSITQDDQFGRLTWGGVSFLKTGLGVLFKARLYRSIYLVGGGDVGPTWEKGSIWNPDWGYSAICGGATLGAAWRFGR